MSHEERRQERGERMFTQAEVSAIVQKRLRESKASALNADVCIEMLRNVMERLDVLEARLDEEPREIINRG